MKRIVLLLTLAVAVALVAGCQSATPAPPAPAAKSAAPAPAPAAKPAAPAAKLSPEQELYEAAKKEGEAIWFNSGTSEDYVGLAEAFSKKYPGVKVSLVNAKSAETPSRIIAESGAGRVSMDVATGSVNLVGPLIERDLLVSNDWAKLDVPANGILLGGKMIVTYEMPYGWVYNTRQVPAADVPQAWEDLLRPNWKGKKIGLLSAGAMGIEGLGISGKWSKEKYDKFLTDLKAQEVIIEPRGAGLSERIADGQIRIGSFPITMLPGMLKAGAPVDLAPMGPVTTKRQAVYVPKGAPHPNAAKLLAGWLGSKNARPEWAKSGRGPAAPCDASDVAKIVCQKKVELFLEETVEISQKITEYEAAQAKLFSPVPQK